MEIFDTTVQVLRAILSASATGWAVSSGLTIVAFAAMRTAFPAKALAAINAPMMLFGALIGILVCQRSGLTFSPDETLPNKR